MNHSAQEIPEGTWYETLSSVENVTLACSSHDSDTDFTKMNGWS